MSAAMKTVAIADLAHWSEARPVVTARGPRLLQTATPTAEFWAAWKASKTVLKAAGVSLSKSDSGLWEACWWHEPEGTRAAIAASHATDSAAEIPSPAGLQYLPFQKAGIAYATARSGTLIADEMGLGKTVQAIGVINDTPALQNALIVCPASLKLNWERELRCWLVRPLSVAIAKGAALPATNIVITNYEMVARQRSQIDARTWDLAIFDESHYLKNPKTARTIAALGRRDKYGTWETAPIKAARYLFLTGTPVLNRPVELWPLLRTLDPAGLGRSYGKYTERYCDRHQGAHGVDVSGASNLDELQARLRSTCMVRRLKADVLQELPPKRRQLVLLPVDSPEAAAALAREQRVSQNTHYDADASALTSTDALALAEIAAARHETALAKVPAAIEFVREVADSVGKAVVFTHHVDVAARIASAFGDHAVLYTGETPPAERQAAVDRFQTDPACTLFVGTIGAAGVGITLTAASHVIMAELEWTPALVSQAEDRTHRIGQRNCVSVYHLVYDGSIDQRMVELLLQKQAVIDAALDNQPQAASASVRTTVEFRPNSEPEARDPVTTVEVPDAAPSPEFSAHRKAAIHLGLRILAGLCDGARLLDDRGFSKLDATIGHSLAAAPDLSQRQAEIGLRLVTRYHRQLPADVLRAAQANTEAQA